jgi:hypothetical protein
MATRQSTSSTSTTTTDPNQIPQNLLDLINQSIAGISNVQQQFPLTDLLQNLAQQIVPLTPLELQLLGQQIATSQAPSITQPELGALTDINQLIGGPIGSSPATIAAMNAYNTFEAPQIAQQLALSGQTNGGAFAQALSQGQTAALAPLLQQEEQNRVSVLPALAGIGSTVADRERSDTATALQAASVPQQTAQEQADANFQDVMRQAGLIQGVDTGVFSQFAPFLVTPGAQTTTGQSSSSTTTPGIWSSLAKKTLVLFASYKMLAMLGLAASMT